MLTMLVAGYMAKQRGAQTGGGLGDLLGGLLRGRAGGGASPLDRSQDGNPLDDILSRAGGLFR